MILLLLALISAQAAPEGCELPYSHAEWEETLVRAGQALLSVDLPAARSDLMEAHRQVLCLPGPADPALTSQLARQLALAFFFDQDEDSVRRWGLLSRVAADLPWEEIFDPSHPFREMVERAELPALAGPDAGLSTPRRGAALLNGAPLDSPQAHIEVPGLLQVVDRKGAVLRAWWIDGSAFPEAALGPKDERKARKKPRKPKPAREQIPAPVQAPPPEAAPAPPPPAVADRAPQSAAEYLDPFHAARNRARSRQTSEREVQGRDGVIGVVRTEVITLASDPSGGRTVTQGHYAQWLLDTPEWAPGGLMARHLGGERYLAGWVGGKAPSPDAPVVSMGLQAALAYCGTWGGTLGWLLESVAVEVAEWRMGPEGPVVLDRGGRVFPANAATLPEEVGFRCDA